MTMWGKTSREFDEITGKDRQQLDRLDAAELGPKYHHAMQQRYPTQDELLSGRKIADLAKSPSPHVPLHRQSWVDIEAQRAQTGEDDTGRGLITIIAGAIVIAIVIGAVLLLV